MNKNILMGIVIAAGLALLGGVVIVVVQTQTQPKTSDGKGPVQTYGTPALSEEKSPEQVDQREDIGTTQVAFSGKVLAGKTTPYLEFNKADYEKAKAEGYVIFLDFYANWCPICRAELPELYAGFDGLNTDKAVGFRVNYKDSDTDDDEKALEKELKVSYQHSKRIIKNGQVVLESAESWDKERVVREINKLL